jgi:carbamoyl-phosphate synthase large subunit
MNASIQKVLVIGSGPIVIGQAAEFDYAGTQACRVLREAGVKIVLINSNPATIMTDRAMADVIYIEPLTLATVKRVIEKERPDSILSGLGGQTGLTLCMKLAKEGVLEKYNVRLLGSSPETIDKAEDRLLFKETMQKINQPVIPSVVSTDVEGAVTFAREIGYPVIVRPAFTLGGTGGGMAGDERELREISVNGLSLSPIRQILVEKSVAGWKEIEFEVMRDGSGHAVSVCSMENFDPVGVHTGDSIVVAPAVSLSDKDLGMLRQAALDIITELRVEGGCNVQFALEPVTSEYAVIEVNPRVSRSSALASKASGYPIAKISTKIAIGYTLNEIENPVTGGTYAGYEPALDYIAVKFPKWPFDKFVYAKKELGTQMKATGEVMSLADTFEAGIMKAVRGAEIGAESLTLPHLAKLTGEDIGKMLDTVTDERLFVVYEAVKRGFGIEEIYRRTKIDFWFLERLRNLAVMEKSLSEDVLTEKLYLRAKKAGFTDGVIFKLTPAENARAFSAKPVYRTVNGRKTGGSGMKAPARAKASPYFYSVYKDEKAPASGKDGLPADSRAEENLKKVLVLGSGPIRIGQGIEFDYACVHCVWTLRKMGYCVIVVNNNPETVSTDFDTADRLYFEPPHIEDVMRVIEYERPIGVIVAFGGGTAIKLTQALHKNGVKILGTSADAIDICEDRERFDKLLESLSIKRPRGLTALTAEEALSAAESLGYPVLLRPSYVLGGQNMIIAYDAGDVKEYMAVILRHKQEQEYRPVLIDMYIGGLEIEVDAICDGDKILIPGIMEHVERTGVHSGDSIAMYPALHIDDHMSETIAQITKRICKAVKAVGLVNIQYVVSNGEVFVIEVNPRASRTVPYISKITGVPMCELATRVCFGETLEELGYKEGIAKIPPYTAVKVPVFSFEKLTDVDTQLGPEMKSTGEVLGIGKNLQEALYKGLIAAGYDIKNPTPCGMAGARSEASENVHGGVFFTVRSIDRYEVTDIAKKFSHLGFVLYATEGTGKALEQAGLPYVTVNKIHESDGDNVMTLLESGKIHYIISTSAKGRDPARDSVKMRRKAVLLGIPCLTSLDTANAVADSLLSGYSESSTELVDINSLRKKRLKLEFAKMQSCGNDYIYIDRMKKPLKMNSPESLPVILSDRHYGIGGDGLVLLLPSEKADARMRMFNLDGSEGEVAGNALRCVAKYLYDQKIVRKTKMKIETNGGVKVLNLYTRFGEVSAVKVNMGRARLKPSEIPMSLDAAKLPDAEAVINRRAEVAGGEYDITCVSMGNPHCVIFTEDAEALNLSEIGPRFEFDPVFPERVNTEFIKVIDRNTLLMRVWERGNGETLSCGTGACAAAVAAVLNGYCDKGTDIRVIQPGGDLIINYTDEQVMMTGDCTFVFKGVMEV